MPRFSSITSKIWQSNKLPIPVNTVAPAVTGTAQARQTLSCSTGTWSGIGLSYSYQWQFGTTNISGATSSTYVIDSIYVGSAIRCIVTASNFGNTVSANSNATSSVAAAVPAAPTIGTATSTSTTTATVSFTAPDNGGSTITSYTATSSPGGITGTLNQAGSGTISISGLTTGQTYTFTVTATNGIGTSSPSSASNPLVVGGTAPFNTVAPAVTGTAQVRQTLSCSTGTWSNSPTSYAYQWQFGTTNISGATSNTYVVDAAYVGSTIRCIVTATNAGGSISANSNSTSAVIANVPLAPTIGTATATSSSTANVTFTAPSSNGGATITTYTATSSPGGITGTLSQSGSGTISVSGLTAGTAYTFTVTATNSAGTSSASSASNSITTPVAWDMLLMGGGGGGVDTATNITIASDDGLPPTHTLWYGSGGGGGGGLLTTNSSTSSGQSIYITVGSGGSGTSAGGSSYYALSAGGAAVTTAAGGGSGANGTKNGGSGGGGGFAGMGFYNGGTGTSGQGNNGGGYNTSSQSNAGGGGGKNGVGATATGTTAPLNGGAGGTGYDLTNFRGGSSTVVAYGGGGGAAKYSTTGTEVDGTNGSTTYPNDYTGPANSGGGARGQGNISAGINQPSRTKSGGSGIVIVRYPGSVAKATGGTTYTATVGGTAYYFHEFTASGTLTFN